MRKNIVRIKSLEEFLSLTEEKGGIHISSKDDRQYYVECRIELRNVRLKEIFLSEIIFKEEFVLTDCHIEKSIFLWHCTFKNRCFFGSFLENGLYANSVIFEKYTNFVNTRSKENFSFAGVKATGVLDFSQAKLENVSFAECRFSNYINFRRAKIGHINIRDITFEESVSLEGVAVNSGSREAMRTLKDLAYKNNNKIAALDFYQKEMTSLESELKSEKGLSAEKFVLFMNRISNNHGVSWTRSLLFTFSIALTFFLLFILFLKEPYYSFEWKGITEFIKVHEITFRYFVEFINPTHKMTFMDEFSPNGWSFVFDLIGRISIGYGIYQTLSSFRKFGFK